MNFKERGDLFGGRKPHFSLYPASEHVVAELKDDLAPYEVSKGTIPSRFCSPSP